MPVASSAMALQKSVAVPAIPVSPVTVAFGVGTVVAADPLGVGEPDPGTGLALLLPERVGVAGWAVGVPTLPEQPVTRTPRTAETVIVFASRPTTTSPVHPRTFTTRSGKQLVAETQRPTSPPEHGPNNRRRPGRPGADGSAARSVRSAGSMRRTSGADCSGVAEQDVALGQRGGPPSRHGLGGQPSPALSEARMGLVQVWRRNGGPAWRCAVARVRRDGQLVTANLRIEGSVDEDATG